MSTATGALTGNEGGCDGGYLASPCLWGTQPEPLVVRLASLVDLAGLRVLDAGCGEGRNAVYLAGLGARVTAVDVSELALRNAAATWPDVSGIDWQLADVRSAQFGDAVYDVVICDSVVHWLPTRADADEMIAALRRTTRPGGWHVLCTFNDRNQHLDGHTNPPRLLLAHHEVLAAYHPSELVEVIDIDVASSHADQPILHHHSVTGVLATLTAGPR